VWDLETGTRMTMFTCDAEVLCCAFTSVQGWSPATWPGESMFSRWTRDSNGSSVPQSAGASGMRGG